MLTLPGLHLKRWCIVIVSATLCAVLLVVAVSSLWFLPHLNDYRNDIEMALSKQTGYAITIKKLSGHWQGLAPVILIHHLRVSDDTQHAIDFPHITLVPSWKSLLSWEPRFSHIRIQAGSLRLQHQQQQLFLNGLLLKKRGGHLDDFLSRHDHLELLPQQFQWQDNHHALLSLTQPFIAYTHQLFSQQLVIKTHTAKNLGQDLSLEMVWRGKAIPQWSSFAGQMTVSAKTLLTSGYLDTLHPTIRLQPLAIHDVSAKISWQPLAKGTQIVIDKLVFANPDLKANIRGSYFYQRQGPHRINMVGDLYQVKATGVAHYFPRQLPQKFLDWFDKALIGGYADRFHFVIRGNPKKFPFVQSQGGIFKAEANISNVGLHFHPLWPDITHINGRIIFRNNKLSIHAQTAQTGGATLTKVKVIIPSIVTQKPIVIVSGTSHTDLDKLLRYTATIPIRPLIRDFARELDAQGKAQLDLALKIHIKQEKTNVAGRVRLDNNTLDFGTIPAPTVSHIKGILYFTEKGIKADNIKLWALNAPLTLNAKINGHQQFITLAGKADSQALAKQYIGFLAPYITGKSDYKATLTLDHGLKNVVLESALVGTQLNAPHPVKKDALVAWPLRLTVQPLASQNYLIDYTLNGLGANGTLVIKKKGRLVAGAIQFGSPKRDRPKSGLTVDVVAQHLALTPWLAMLHQTINSQQPTHLPVVVNLYTQTLAALNTIFDDVSATLKSNGQGSIQGTVETRQVNAKFHYHYPSATLNTNLSQLDSGAFSVFKEQSAHPLTSIKAIHVNIDALYYHDMHLGQLKLQAAYERGHWHIPSLMLFHPDGATLTANFHNAPSPDKANERITTGSFAFKTPNLGTLLDSLGYQNLVRNAQVQLSGQLSWAGEIGNIDPHHLNGDMALVMSQGSFAKINQGISRLLSVLSLQSLARRTQGDFSDIFGQGFAFNHIAGEIALINGILATQDLSLSGPTADAALVGTLNLQENTQQLNIRVIPHLSEGAAVVVSALTFSPWIGIATLIGQKAINNPLEKIWTFTYDVSGSIDNPIVEKRPSNDSIIPWDLLSE